jgi:hypothetical protein
MAYFFIKARNIHHTLHMGLQSVRHHATTGSGHFAVTKYPDPDVTLIVLDMESLSLSAERS